MAKFTIFAIFLQGFAIVRGVPLGGIGSLKAYGTAVATVSGDVFPLSLVVPMGSELAVRGSTLKGLESERNDVPEVISDTNLASDKPYESAALHSRPESVNAAPILSLISPPSTLTSLALPTQLIRTAEVNAAPTGTAGIEALLERRITMPPATMAAIIAVAVAFFVSVGTAVAYCLRKSTGRRKCSQDTDLESGKRSKERVEKEKKRVLVDTKGSKKVKPVEIQVKVEVLGPTTISTMAHEDEKESDDEGSNYGKGQLGKKGRLAMLGSAIRIKKAGSGVTKIRVMPVVSSPVISTPAPNVTPNSVSGTQFDAAQGSTSAAESEVASAVSAIADPALFAATSANGIQTTPGRPSISSIYSDYSDYSDDTDRDHIVADRDSGFQESSLYSGQRSRSLLGLRSALELPIVRLFEEPNAIELSKLSPAPAILLSLNGGEHKLAPREVSRFSCSSGASYLNGSGTCSIYATSIVSSDDGISAVSASPTSEPMTPASAAGREQVSTQDRAPSVASSASTSNGESIRERIKRKRISLRRGLGFSGRDSETGTGKESLASFDEVPAVAEVRTSTKTSATTASDKGDKKKNEEEKESLSNKYKRFSRVRHIFTR